MSADAHTLEPFPLFVDSGNPSPDYLAQLDILSMVAMSAMSQLRKSRASTTAKISNSIRLRYYQYEVTIGLYVMNPTEKLIVNSIVIGIMGALLYALYFGLQPFLIRSICQLIYYLNGSLSGVEDICTDVGCS